jgi:hypothetical protein
MQGLQQGIGQIWSFRGQVTHVMLTHSRPREVATRRANVAAKWQGTVDKIGLEA